MTEMRRKQLLGRGAPFSRDAQRSAFVSIEDALRCASRLNGGRTAHAFTLIEMVMSLAVLSILVVVLGSALTLALKANGTSASNASDSFTAGDVADRITADLNVAENFTDRSTATAVTFTVPDRNNDGHDETIRYALSGTALSRQYNGGTAVTLASNVKAFSLSYLTRLQGPTAPAGDTQLATYSNALLGGPASFNVNSTSWGSEYIQPSVGSASTWTLTRVFIYMKAGAGTDAVLKVMVTAASGSHAPSNLSAPLAQTIVYESACSTGFEYVEVPFANPPTFSAGQGICIVVAGVSGTSPYAVVQYESDLLGLLGSLLNGAYWSTSSNGGGSWSSALGTQCLWFQLYGTTH